MTQQQSTKPEWTKIGNVEVCIGTDGVTGVLGVKGYVLCFAENGIPEYATKEAFEVRHCQPPKPRHIIREYSDGSVVVESIEQDQQGRPLRCAIVRTSVGTTRWGATWSGGFEWFDERQDAINRAIRYVETGERCRTIQMSTSHARSAERFVTGCTLSHSASAISASNASRKWKARGSDEHAAGWGCVARRGGRVPNNSDRRR